MTPTSWADALLQRLGMPMTPANVSAVVAWERAEGGHWGNSAEFNPLNTTQGEPGAHPMNSVGVEAYTSWDEGLNATVTTLRNGHYGPILSALQRGSSARDVASAVAATPWGTGTGVLQALGVPYTPSSSSSTSSSSTGAASPAASVTTEDVFWGGRWDPLNWFAAPLARGEQNAVAAMEQLLLTGTGLAVGVALVVIGAARALAPARQHVETTVHNVQGAVSSAAVKAIK